MTLFTKGNSLLLRSAKLNGASVICFSLPAYKAQDGFQVCPLAGKCADDNACYAMRGTYSWPAVRKAFEQRLEVARSEDFILKALPEIDRALRASKRAGLKLFVRVHDSGDFFSRHYLEKWTTIAAHFPEAVFYAYTKSLTWVRALRAESAIPSNFVFTFSEGGKLDDTIDRETEKHSRLFPTLAELEQAGYVNGTRDDLVAADPAIIKVGLIYHGGRKGAESWGLPWAGSKAYTEGKR